MKLLTLGAALTLSATAALAAGKPAQFWNLTSETVTAFRIAPAGSDKFGANLAAADSDGSVDHDERLRLPNQPAGKYDIEVTFKNKRCFARNVAIAPGKVFSLEDKDLKDCAAP